MKPLALMREAFFGIFFDKNSLTLVFFCAILLLMIVL